MSLRHIKFLMMTPICLTLILIFLLSAEVLGGLSDDEVFFENKVRPIFVENCLKCHGPEKQKGGLRMDTYSFLMKGGDSGPSIVVGDHKASLMTLAIHWKEDLEMPPKEQLPKNDINTIERWIDMGAPWPQSEKGDIAQIDPFQEILKKAETHWSFQPIKKSNVNLKNSSRWVKNEIDHFISEKMKHKNLQPSVPADDITLMRRLYLNLLGMPPSVQEARKFHNSKLERDEKFSKLIDQLLSDSRYGERWGRHWLDVARYGDTKGPIFAEIQEYPYAFTYRDYVINSYNEDKPFNQFLREQLAADLIVKDPNAPALAALGFLTVHRRTFMANEDEAWIDRVDTTTRAMLGLTVTCARCHDHKYDPISIKDYYSLMGIFASVEEPGDMPVINRPKVGSALERDYLDLENKMTSEIEAFKSRTYNKFMKKHRKDIPKYLRVVYDNLGKSDNELRTIAGENGKLNPDVIIRWSQLLSGEKDQGIWKPWRTLRKNKTDSLSQGDLKSMRLNPILLDALKHLGQINITTLIQVYSKIFKEIEIKSVAQNENNPHFLQFRKFLFGEQAPGVLPLADFSMLNTKAFTDLVAKNAEKLIALSKYPGAPQKAMVVKEKEHAYEPHVFIRGNRDRLGDPVKRQFLKVLSKGSPKPFENGSGRLELAEAITDPTNPLTARVMVNRIWMQHFGTGLVKTPSDFGLRSEVPSHPKLLDWLAGEFIKHNWSIKHLHRLILNSSTYQQSSHLNQHYYSIDPDNRLLWRFPTRRLEFEAIYDSMLSVSGKLDNKLGGPPVLLTKVSDEKQKNKITWEFNPYRRAIYGVVDRVSLPAMMSTFDFPNPDESSAQRSITTVPTQSLYMMNNPFVMEMARSVMDRPIIVKAKSKTDRIKSLYEVLFNRMPSERELKAGLKFFQPKQKSNMIENHQSNKMIKTSLKNETPIKLDHNIDLWSQYAQVLLISNQFIFLR